MVNHIDNEIQSTFTILMVTHNNSSIKHRDRVHKNGCMLQEIYFLFYLIMSCCIAHTIFHKLILFSQNQM